MCFSFQSHVYNCEFASSSDVTIAHFLKLSAQEGKEKHGAFQLFGTFWMTCACARCLAVGPGPDAALVHEVDLALDDLLAILGMLHGFAIQVQVFGINRLLVEHLSQLSHWARARWSRRASISITPATYVEPAPYSCLPTICPL